MALGLILFVITFIVLSAAKLMLAEAWPVTKVQNKCRHQ